MAVTIHIPGWHCNQVAVVNWARSVTSNPNLRHRVPPPSQIEQAAASIADCPICLSNFRLARKVLQYDDDDYLSLRVLF